MCKFFSCVSDGKGNIKFFDLQDIVAQMAIGNPKTYSWNSHTSICQFHGINSRAEDLWNKWEYNPEKDILEFDTLNTKDDSPVVKEALQKWFKGKDVLYLRNLYNRNSGDRNSGYGNSGDLNSGYGNSGDLNSGDLNSGDLNSGYGNSGDRNSGDRNSGYGNSGDLNSGDLNSGDRNSGYGNSGDRNSGDLNSGYGNSGYGNSGDLNNSFCQKQHFILFDKPCKEEEYRKVFEIDYSWFNICDFVWAADMTEQEKMDNPSHITCEGFLRIKSYKDAWKSCPDKELAKIKKLKNFNAKTFENITGLK